MRSKRKAENALSESAGQKKKMLVKNVGKDEVASKKQNLPPKQAEVDLDSQGSHSESENEELLKGLGSEDDESESDSSSGKDESEAVPKKRGSRQLMALADEDTAALKKRTAKVQKGDTPGVVYLGRIPHGFYEDEMRSYFSQFGPVTQLRLSRNKKTGKSKHYAFIEFDDEQVAKIVAETMHNYLMFNRLLQCRFIPQDQVPQDLFKGANRKFVVTPKYKIIQKEVERPRSVKELGRIRRHRKARQLLQSRKRKSLGIDYDYSRPSKADAKEKNRENDNAKPAHKSKARATKKVVK